MQIEPCVILVFVKYVLQPPPLDHASLPRSWQWHKSNFGLCFFSRIQGIQGPSAKSRTLPKKLPPRLKRRTSKAQATIEDGDEELAFLGSAPTQRKIGYWTRIIGQRTRYIQAT
ncbi:hypothetical protein B0H14DRAFT_2599590 [Mycena olivaceomarginata]|nr:hypothetical protein B0H14DRAFT_2599590 [Mycena olivaceomarginata]